MNSLEPQEDPHGFVENMNWLWTVDDPRLNGSKVLLLAVLINFAGNGQTCWPGQSTLAKRARMSESTVRRLLAELEEIGYISREHRQRGNGSRTSDLVTLHLIQPLKLSGRNGSNPTAQFERKAEHDLPLNPGGPTAQIERGTNPEEESRLEEPSSAPAALTAAPRGATGLPAEWVPNEKHRQYAELHGLSLKAESSNFRTYYLDGNGATKRHKDWNRAFTNWMLRGVQRLQADGKYRPRLAAVPPPPPTPADDEPQGWWGSAPREQS